MKIREILEKGICKKEHWQEQSIERQVPPYVGTCVYGKRCASLFKNLCF
jgi:hypothetical protein